MDIFKYTLNSHYWLKPSASALDPVYRVLIGFVAFSLPYGLENGTSLHIEEHIYEDLL